MKKLIQNLPLLFVITLFAACGGSGSSGSNSGLNPAPSFNPDAQVNLEELVVNTFSTNGFNITTNPEYIDFTAQHGTLEQGDVVEEEFTLHNNTSNTHSFRFDNYSTATGFAILNENGQNIGIWTGIELAAGESQTFTVQFNAWQFGTQTSFLNITADIDGYIQFPLRASVTGSAEFKIVKKGTACSDSDASPVEYLDFLKVAYGNSRTLGLKICNSGGQDVVIDSAQFLNTLNSYESQAMISNAYEEFIWTVSDEINSSFAFGSEPSEYESFASPRMIDSGANPTNAAGTFSIKVTNTGKTLQNLLIPAGQHVSLDVTFEPNLNIEAPFGTLYNPVGFEADLQMQTSLGTLQIPVVGASSGSEPMLQLSYRMNETDAFRPIDLNSDGSAIYFGEAKLFLDWVSNNSLTAEIKVENIGSDSTPLKFYGRSINGFYEYYWDDPSAPLNFPLVVTNNTPQTFKIRYLPAATATLEEDYAQTFDFGQFYFEHNGGNGPQDSLVLLGQQDAGYAVEAKLGGTNLKRTYESGQFQNFCVFITDASNPTPKTFTIVNNNQYDEMSVTYNISGSDFTATPSTQTLTVPAGESNSFTVEFSAVASASGQTVEGVMEIETEFPATESTYSSETTSLQTRNFTIPFRATGSETGESLLCGSGAIGNGNEDIQTTFIVDRVTMVMTDLTEPAHNPPGFRFHFPITVNQETGQAWINKDISIQTEEDEINPITGVRSYVHQAVGSGGCPAYPTNPYRLEFQKGSWNGKGIECSDDGPGTIVFRDPVNSEQIKIDSDTACAPNNGFQDYTDPITGEHWKVHYTEFYKFNDCAIEYYGKISTFAYKYDETKTPMESIREVMLEAEARPNENEEFYENVYGAYRFDSHVTFLEDTKCSGITYGPGGVQPKVTDPDTVKDCFLSLSKKSDATRNEGLLNECSYFLFDIPATDPEDGVYEPHFDGSTTHDTKYDITLNNVHVTTLVLGTGDRRVFFSHPGHLIYSEFDMTITTKPLAEEEWMDSSDWNERIAPDTRPHIDKNQIYVLNGERYDIDDFWVEDGLNNFFSNVIDEEPLSNRIGENVNGTGRGTFKYHSAYGDQMIIPSGWPINFDENNLGLMVGLGTFRGQGNTAPSFAKADASTGKGKALYFAFHGCLVNGEAPETQGCFDFRRDDATMPDSTQKITDVYTALDMLPGGAPTDSSECAQLSDPGFYESETYQDLVNTNPYYFMACIDYKLNDFDRERYKNYYDKAGRFEYKDDPYGTSTCAYGN